MQLPVALYWPAELAGCHVVHLRKCGWWHAPRRTQVMATWANCGLKTISSLSSKASQNRNRSYFHASNKISSVPYQPLHKHPDLLMQHYQSHDQQLYLTPPTIGTCQGLKNCMFTFDFRYLMSLSHQHLQRHRSHSNLHLWVCAPNFNVHISSTQVLYQRSMNGCSRSAYRVDGITIHAVNHC